MKKIIFKILLLALTACMLLGLASCSAILEKLPLDKLPFDIPGLNTGNNGGDNGGGGEGENLEGLVLIKDKVAQFKIVYTNDAASSAKTRADELVRQLRSLGITIDDPVREGDKTKISDCEIILGTGAKNRGSECNITEIYLGKEGMLAKVVGKRIIIAGGTEELTLSLFNSFIRTQLKITSGTSSLNSLAISEDYYEFKETDYRIDSIKIDNIDLSEFKLVFDLTGVSSDTQKALNAFQQDLYDVSGYWLEKASANKLDTYEHSFILRCNEDSGEYGFRAYYDGKNFIVECAYEDVFAQAFDVFSKEELLNKRGNLSFKDDYSYEKFDATYECMKIYSDERLENLQKRMLERIRNGSKTSNYGAYAVSVLGLSDEILASRNDITPEEAISRANEGIRLVSNWLHSDLSANDTAKGRGEVDFVAIRVVRALYLEHPERLESETEEHLRRFFLQDLFDSTHQSENHILMGRVSRYLAANYYKGEYFSQYGKSAEELLEEDHEYLIYYMQRRAQRGWGEFNSMGYEIHNFNTLMTLYECAPHQDIRDLASMLMETMLVTMFENTTENGVYGGAHGRGYDTVVTGRVHSGIVDLYRLYFGLGDIDDTTSDKVYINDASECSIVLSKWHPDKILYEMAEAKDKLYPFTSYERVQNHTLNNYYEEYGNINKYTYVTKGYAIGCVNYQESFASYPYSDSSYWWYEEHQQTNFTMVFAEQQRAGITVHHPGKDSLHSYWYGDQACHCNHLFGEKNVVMGIFDIPDSQTYKYIHAYVPQAIFPTKYVDGIARADKTNPIEVYDEIIEDPDNNRIFVRVGDTYAALIFSESYQWGGGNNSALYQYDVEEYQELIIYDRDEFGREKTTDVSIAFACQAGDKENDGTFQEFIASVKSKTFNFDQDNLTLEYGDMRYEYEPGSVPVERHYLKGELLDMNYTYTYNSPLMKSEYNSGVIEFYCGNKVRKLDFLNITAKNSYVD